MSSSSVSGVFGVGACCLNPGHLLEVNPKGSTVTIAGVECYRTGSNAEKVVLLSTDVFGLRYDNPRLIADVIAAGGFTVIVPNTLNDAMDPHKPFDFAGFPEWLGRNSHENAATVLEKVASHLHSEGVKSISATGFCYGCKPISILLQKNAAHLTTVVYNHPSFLALGEGAKMPKGLPLLVNCAEIDRIYTPDIQNDFEKGAKQAGVHLQVIYYPKTQHGFAARVQDEDKVKGQQNLEAASVNSLKFFQLNA